VFDSTVTLAKHKKITAWPTYKHTVAGANREWLSLFIGHLCGLCVQQ